MSEAITEINQDTFWELIERSKNQPRDPERWLRDQLTAMGEKQAMMFGVIADAYATLADEYGLWTAATVIDESCYSEKEFRSFRMWLVGQGKDVYMAALADPDSLADGPSYLDKQFNRLAYVGGEVCEDLTGESCEWMAGDYTCSALRDELRRGIVYDKGIGYPYDWPDVPKYVPRLYQKYLVEQKHQWYSCYTARVNTWNLDNPSVSAARNVAQKSTKVKDHDER